MSERFSSFRVVIHSIHSSIHAIDVPSVEIRWNHNGNYLILNRILNASNIVPAGTDVVARV